MGEDQCTGWIVQPHAHEILLDALQSCSMGHKEGLAPFVHLPLALQMLGTDLDSDCELEE